MCKKSYNLALIILLIFAGSIYAQKNPLKVKANLAILDADNNLVDDVDVKNIRIFEDGIEQKIDNIVKKNSNNVGIMIDKSGSLRNQFQIAKLIANKIVENLSPNDETFVTSFVGNENITLMQDWTADKNLLKKRIEEITLEGGESAVLDAVYVSVSKIKEKKDNAERNVIIVISDVEERNSYYSRKQVLKLLEGENIQIYIIGLVQDLQDSSDGFNPTLRSPKEKAAKLAEDLASQTSGLAFYPNYSTKDYASINQAITTIIVELRSQYVVQYTSTNQKKRDETRRLKIEIPNNSKGEKRFGLIREEITVPKN